jgi:hypothetical protein
MANESTYARHLSFVNMWWGALTDAQRKFIGDYLQEDQIGPLKIRAYNFDGVWINVPGWPERKEGETK